MNSLTSLGLVATHRRKIESGREYDRYFPASEGNHVMINQMATVFDTLDHVVSMVKRTTSETAKISKVLKKGTTRDTLKSVFDFTYNHIQYAKDKDGVEQLRTPARAWADRKDGIDCDCFSVFVGSILTNLHIPHYFRIIKRNGAAEYSHIYVVIPKIKRANLNNRNEYWVIDPVLNRFDKEADSITQKYDKMGNIPLEELNGLGEIQQVITGLSDTFGVEYEHLEGLMGYEMPDSYGSIDSLEAEAEIANKIKNKALKLHLINTRKKLRTHHGSKLYDKVKFDQALSYVISCWDNPQARDEALRRVSQVEHRIINYPAVKAIHGYGGLSGLFSSTEVIDLLGEADDHYDGLGKIKFFKKIAAAVKTTGKKLAQTAKKVGKKVGAVAKKVVKAIKKLNPLSVSIRAGFLLACKINFAGVAKKLMYGYMTKEQAIAKGVPLDNWQASRDALQKTEKMWKNLLAGDVNKLKSAILSGKRKNLLSGLDNVGELGIAPALAALTPALAFLAKIKTLIGKAFKGVKKVVDIVDKGKGSEKENEESAQLDNFQASNPEAVNDFNPEAAVSSDSGQGNDNTEQVSNLNTADPSGTTGQEANLTNENANTNANNTQNQSSKGGNGALIGILAAAGIGLAVAVGGGKKKGKGVSGTEDGKIEDDITQNLSGAGKKRSTRKVKGTKKSKKTKHNRSRKSGRRKVYKAVI